MALVHSAQPIHTSKYLVRNDSQMSTPTSTYCSSSSSDDENPTPSSSTRRLPLSSSTSTPRKIRFAPLPDPRRSVFVTDDGDELPIHTDDSDDEIPNSVSYELSAPHLSIQPASPVSPSTPFASPKPSSPSLPPTPELTEKPKPWFLRPFTSKRTSSVASNISTEELLTLGTINLFRTSSRESRRSVNSTRSDCSPLSRWASNTSKRDTGEPLSRSQSLTGSNPQRAARAGSGTRLLNGRVYGRRKPSGQHNNNPNPFANARDEEPTFVEWGYGGMGSVKNTSGDSRWSKVQSSGTGLDDGDDGSGTAWARKRREARERAAKEKAEAESAEAAKKEAAVVEEPQQPPQAEQPSSASTEAPQKETTSPSRPEHISAVTLPAQLQRHQSTHSHSSRSSADPVSSTHDGSQTPSSEESSEAEDEDDSDDSDDDDEEPFIDDDKHRRTALGAGVEKISRHN